MGNFYYSEHYSTFASPKDQAGTFINKESEGMLNYYQCDKWDMSEYKLYKLTYGYDGNGFWDTVLAHNVQEAVDYFHWCKGNDCGNIYKVEEKLLSEITAENIHELPHYVCPPDWKYPESLKIAERRSYAMWKQMFLERIGIKVSIEDIITARLEIEDSAEIESKLTECGFRKIVTTIKEAIEKDYDVDEWDAKLGINRFYKEPIYSVEYVAEAGEALDVTPTDYTFQKLNIKKKDEITKEERE